MRTALALLFVFATIPWTWAKEIPRGPFTQSQCIACHERETRDLVTAWRKGPHGNSASPVDCVACHGNRHTKSLAKARSSEICVTCHEASKPITVRSHFTSKHGVIVTLNGKKWDWSAPLAEANYRAPSCAYCHMHEASHGQPANDDAVTSSCTDCHAPGYADTIIESGKRTLKIGELKVREAEMAVRAALEKTNISKSNAETLNVLLKKMRQQSLTSLRLGLGHHSPDYQWWYGQAALDGDLIRIKAWITRLYRAPPASKKAHETD